MKDLDRLRGLIVSVQAPPDSPLAPTEMITALALAAQTGGASAVRIESATNVRAAKAALHLPIIGLIKRAHAGFEPYITSTTAEVDELIDAGADVIAFDATLRARPDGVTTNQLCEHIQRGGATPMADCSNEEDAVAARELGVPIIATTLHGYTKETSGASLPAIDLVRTMRGYGGFVVCEGGVHRPADVAAAHDAGADAIVVGTAITNVVWVTAQFAAPLRARTRTDATAVK